MQIVLPIKRPKISAMAEYCDPDLMLITETKLDSILLSELLPKCYVGEFRNGSELKRQSGHDRDKTVILLLTLYSRLPPKMRLNWSGTP